MHSKGFFKFLSIYCFVLISACSSTKTAHVSCDFVGGAADSAIERHEKKKHSDIHGNKAKSSQNTSFIDGILSVFSGILTRAASSGKKTTSKCT